MLVRQAQPTNQSTFVCYLAAFSSVDTILKDMLYPKKADVGTYIKADFLSHSAAVPHIVGILI